MGDDTVAIARRERPALIFSDEQKLMIRNAYASGASEQEFEVLLEIAKAKRLSPLLGQVHFVKRYDRDRGEVWATQTGIDGFRSIAEDTGLYDGQDETEFEYDGKLLVLARTKVYRKDIGRPFVGVARYEEFVQRVKDGNPNRMWASKPHVMLAKVSEAIAFRKAFPLDLAQVYTAEELPHDQPSQAEQLAAQSAPPPTESPYVDPWLPAIAAAKDLAELEALAARMHADKKVKGAYRTTLGAAWKNRANELRPAKDPRCDECGLAGAHAEGCPQASRQPGADDA